MVYLGASSKMSDGPQRVIVTGANGLIGRLAIDAWRADPRYDAVGLARSEGPHTDILADLADLDALVAAFQGADAIVHLGATSAVGSEWDAVLHSNLIGTYNVFEAARQAGVKRVVFASTNHTIGSYELDTAPEVYELDDDRVWDEQSELRPDSLYGVSKVYGEAMARYYVDHHGLKAYCIRIGGTRDQDSPTHPNNLWAPERDGEEGIKVARKRMRAVWLSERDCIQLFERALASDLDWVLCYGISENPRQFWSIEHAKDILGYEPQDSAPAEIFPER